MQDERNLHTLDFRKWSVGDWMLAIGSGILLYAIINMVPPSVVGWLTNPSETFPVGVGGRRWIYGVALFALLSTSCLSMAVLIDNLRCLKAYGNRDWRHPLNVSIIIETLYLSAIVMGFAPDTVVLLLYGEQSTTGMETVLLANRIFDILCLFPIVVAFLIRTRGLPIIMFQLTKEPIPGDMWPTWMMVRERLFMLFLALVISMGVAVAR